MNSKLILFLALISIIFSASGPCHAKCGGDGPVNCSTPDEDTCKACSAATDKVITPKSPSTIGEIMVLPGTCGAACPP